MAGLHHVEIWVADAETAREEWAWLLERLGWSLDGTWEGGFTFAADGAYLTFTESPNLVGHLHDRRRPGLNHLAFEGGTPADVDGVIAAATAHGWTPLYSERYPHAGGPDHYAGWIASPGGFKAEIVATGRRDGATRRGDATA